MNLHVQMKHQAEREDNLEMIEALDAELGNVQSLLSTYRVTRDDEEEESEDDNQHMVHV